MNILKNWIKKVHTMPLKYPNIASIQTLQNIPLLIAIYFFVNVIILFFFIQIK